MRELIGESLIFEAMIQVDTRWIADKLETVKSKLIAIASKTGRQGQSDKVFANEMGKVLTDLFKEEKIVFKYQAGPNRFGIVGGYTLDDKIEIYYHEDFYVEMFEGDYWNDIRDTIVGTLHHELVHRQQIARGKIKTPGISRAKLGFGKELEKWEDYYGSVHEVMAYATSVYWEMIFAGLSHDSMKNIIRQNDGQLARISDVYNEYEELFDRNHPVIKKLLRYVADLVSRGT